MTRRLTYVEFLERLREHKRFERERPDPLDGVELPRRRNASKRLEIRITPDQRAFLRSAAEATRSPGIDESTIVAASLALLERLGVEWEAVGNKKELIDAIRRRLQSLGHEPE